MDLNELYGQHQIALMRADAAPTPQARDQQRERAGTYIRMIDAERDRNGATECYGMMGRPLG